MKTKGIVTTEQITAYNNAHGGFLKISKAINSELSLKGMLISCFAYGGISKDSYHFEKYILPYQKQMSLKTFEDVYNEMEKSFEKTEIQHGVYTDSEGCSYNEIIYK